MGAAARHGGGVAAENVVGIDPHKHTLTATVLDQRGGMVGQGHFKVSGTGHRAMQEWAVGFGPVARWGVEGSGGVGRHTATYLCAGGHDVREVCPTRTSERARRRSQGKTDVLDSERIARETLAHPDLPRAFKRGPQASGPDERTELLSLWHKERRSITKVRRQLLSEVETLLGELPEELRQALPATKAVRPRLRALGRRDQEQSWDPPTALRLKLLDEHARQITELERREKEATRALDGLVSAAGSTLQELTGVAAELLVEVGDPRRFTEGGFARFNGTAPLPASSAEGDGQPVRHRLNRGGNRRVNAVLHRIALTQLRCEPRARTIYSEARTRGHTKKEAMRVLKRRLSDVVYRRMARDAASTRPHLGGRLT